MFVVGLYFVLSHNNLTVGHALSETKTPVIKQTTTHNIHSFKEYFNNFKEPLSILLIQIIVIIFISRILSLVAVKLHQPSVIGEITAGIILGPSLLGYYFPEINHFLFSSESLLPLQYLSQIGLILFMFVIGMDLDINFLRNQFGEAAVISVGGTMLPFLLGTASAIYLYTNFAPANVNFIHFALFIGIAMSITAFPVLARIIHERGLTKTHLGSMAITCAAIGDILAWLIFAAIIAIVKAGTLIGAIYSLGFTFAYIIFMWFIVRKLLNKMGDIYASSENLSKTVLAFLFLILLFSSLTTELIGIHALFGAFVAGVIVPFKMNIRKILTEKIEDISMVLLLPLFFVFTGLRTQLGLLNSPHLWVVTFFIILVAFTGKFGSTFILGKMAGHSSKDSLSLGMLMNARGLMELIVLNIGFELGIFSAQIFTMFVIMALFTTIMTTPSLEIINFISTKFTKITHKTKKEFKYKILISFGQPRMGSSLLLVASLLVKRKSMSEKISALHITPSTDLSYNEALLYESEGFASIKKTASELDINIATKYRISSDVSKEICHIAKFGMYDLLLMGAAKSLFSQNIMGGKIKSVIENTNCQTGVLFEKSLQNISSVILLIYFVTDRSLLSFIYQLHLNAMTEITIIDISGFRIDNPKFYQISKTVSLLNIPKIKIMDYKNIENNFLLMFDLVILSAAHWQKLSESNSTWIDNSPSILIMTPNKTTKN